jgi:hypothetical protein
MLTMKVVLATVVPAALLPTAATTSSGAQRPNLLLVMCDDLDTLLGSEIALPQTRRLLASSGARAMNLAQVHPEPLCLALWPPLPQPPPERREDRSWPEHLEFLRSGRRVPHPRFPHGSSRVRARAPIDWAMPNCASGLRGGRQQQQQQQQWAHQGLCVTACSP